MNIAVLSMTMSQINLGLQVGISRTKLSMDTLEQSGQMMADMLKSIELSVNPNVGSKINIKL